MADELHGDGTALTTPGGEPRAVAPAGLHPLTPIGLGGEVLEPGALAATPPPAELAAPPEFDLAPPPDEPPARPAEQELPW